MKKLTKTRRNEIAFTMVMVQMAGDGIHFPKPSAKARKTMKKHGIKKSELVEFAREMAGMLAKKSFKKS
jgi:hypothetical protein